MFKKNPPLQQNPRAPQMSRLVAEGLETGEFVRPDADNPDHQALLDIVGGISKEMGREVSVYIVPIRGLGQDTQHLSRLQSIGRFSAIPKHDEMIVPEAAAELFTRAETEAVLAHEFDHLSRPELARQKAEQSMRYSRADIAESAGRVARLPAAMREKLEAKATERWQALSDTATELEVRADENAIATGRASDLIGALQKMTLCEQAAEAWEECASQKNIIALMDVPPEQLAEERVIRDKLEEYSQPRSADPHTKESFVERLARLEKAAALEGEKQGRGR